MLKTQLCKSIRILLVSLTACGCALAQYGGGGGMGGGTTGTGGYSSTSHSYGHGAVIGAVAGAGAGATILYLALHHRRQVIGCIGPDGKTLTRTKTSIVSACGYSDDGRGTPLRNRKKA